MPTILSDAAHSQVKDEGIELSKPNYFSGGEHMLTSLIESAKVKKREEYSLR